MGTVLHRRVGIASLAAEVERLRAELLAREQEIAAQKALNDQQALQLQEAKQQVQALTESNEALAQKLALIELKLTGRKSERWADPAQLSLLGDAVSEPPPRLPGKEDEPEPSAEQKKEERSRRRKESGRTPKRRNLAERTDLPMRTVTCPVDAAAACARCHKPLVVIGQAESWRIHWEPGHFERLHVVRDKCACPACPSEGVLVVPDPFVLPRAMCSNSLLAQVLVDKFADHLPLNRQAARMERQGFDISTAVLASWVLAVAHPDRRLLSRVADAIEQQLWRADALQGDNTGQPVQDGLDGMLRKGRLWVCTDGQQARYWFTDSKEGKHIRELLEGYQGELLLVDAGSEFNEVTRDTGLLRGGCWSHLRRYFFEARLYHPVEASLALRTIRDLFALERSLKKASLEEIRAVRQRDALPLVEGFFAWLDRISVGLRPQSLLYKAVGYAKNHRDSFELYLDRPELALHNNLSELLLRGPVVGRKNWLFARSEGGAVAAATMFTLIGSCMLQAVDPLVYLTDVLDRLPTHPANRVHELTPLQWRLAREQDAGASSPDPL